MRFVLLWQGSLGALIVGNLASRGLVSLQLFAALPEDNEFSFSPRFVHSHFCAFTCPVYKNEQYSELFFSICVM